MSVSSYKLKILNLRDFDTVFSISKMLKVLKAWRNGFFFEKECTKCNTPFSFSSSVNFKMCCEFLYLNPCKEYIVRSVAVHTPKCHFLSSYLKTKLKKHNVSIDQSYLVLPDPIYWQRSSVTVFETSLKFIQSPKLRHTKVKNVKGSFHEDFPELNSKLISIQQKIIDAPLYHCSLATRTQGKETLYRKIAIPKRAEKTARAMIVPAPHLSPNQVVLPEKMALELDVFNKWVIVNRMPSLSAESFVALFVVQMWKHDVIGLPCEILDGLHADFDGDEVNVWPVYSSESQFECEIILNSRENMKSFKNGLKLFPSQDMIIAYYLAKPSCIPFEFRNNSNNNSNNTSAISSLMNFFRAVYELEGSRSCFNWFDYMRQYYLHVLENKYCFAISWKEFADLRDICNGNNNGKNSNNDHNESRNGDNRSRNSNNNSKISYEEFENIMMTKNNREEGCLEIQVKSGAKGTLFHLYQLVGSVGYQKLRSKMEYVQSSFLEGLTPREYIIHAKSGHDALIESMIGVWKPGYNYSKIVNNTQNIIVDYEGRLMDGDQILCDDALEETYYEDLLSNQTFNWLFKNYFPSS